MKRLLILFCCIIPWLLPAQDKHSHEADSLIATLKHELRDTQRVNRLNMIAQMLDSEESPDADQYAREALKIAHRANYLQGEARANLMMGYSEEGKSNFAAAITFYEQSAKISRQLSDSLGIARALGNQANAEYFIGDYAASAEHAAEAIRIHEGLKNIRGIISSHIALGNVYADQKLYSDALQQYREALVVGQQVPEHPDYAARPLASIGNVYQFRKDFDSCIWYYSEALKAFEAVHARTEISVCLNNMATARREQNRTSEAEQLLRRSLVIRREIGDTDGVCSIYQNLSGVAADRGKKDSSLYFIRYALQLSYLTGSLSQRLDCFKGMAESFYALGNTDSAYYYLDHYTNLNDSLRSQENMDALSEIRMRYNDEKQKNQLEVIESAHRAEQAVEARNRTFLIGGIVLLLAFSIVMFYRYRVKQRLSFALERKNSEISMQKTAITDSINYAKKIQDSILPPDHHVQRILPESFIMYEPKDVVSGDFYWVEQNKDIAIFAAVDCTGHGVPGALMSVIGFNLLNQAVNEMGLTKPSDILHHLDYGVNKMLRQSDEGNTVKDGMDLALCSYDPKNRTLQYAGVFNPAYIVSKGVLRQIKADKFPIGINVDGKADDYTNHTLQLEPGDMIYLFSDGYADQFGGENGKKFMYNRFRNLLVEIYQLPVNEQKIRLREAFHSWKGGLEQVDDVLVIGVRVS